MFRERFTLILDDAQDDMYDKYGFCGWALAQELIFSTFARDMPTCFWAEFLEKTKKGIKKRAKEDIKTKFVKGIKEWKAGMKKKERLDELNKFEETVEAKFKDTFIKAHIDNLVKDKGDQLLGFIFERDPLFVHLFEAYYQDVQDRLLKLEATNAHLLKHKEDAQKIKY